MTESDKKKTLRANTYLWIGAMIIPAIFDFSFKWFANGPVRFPWPMVIPFLFFGFLNASNTMLANAIGETSEDATKSDLAK